VSEKNSGLKSWDRNSYREIRNTPIKNKEQASPRIMTEKEGRKPYEKHAHNSPNGAVSPSQAQMDTLY